MLSKPKLVEIVEKCENTLADVYDKAIILLTGIIRKHPFASGNRRTAFLVMIDFLLDNTALCGLKDEPENARVLPEYVKAFILTKK